MAEIKIDEEKYFYLLTLVKEYIEESIGATEEKMKEQGKEILFRIEREFSMRDLMRERKMYYDFYMKNKERNPEEAREAYRHYKETKYKLEKEREKE